MSVELSVMEQRHIRQTLCRYRHHHCPENYQTGNILSDSDFMSSPMNSEAVKAAVRSYQSMFRDDLNRLTYRDKANGGYKRASIADGYAGRNTYEVLNYPRCGHADFRDISSSTPLEGNWPDQCRNDITIARDFQSLPGVDRQRTDSAFQKARDNWNNALVLTIVLVDINHEPLRGRITLANLPGGVLADQYLAISNCGFTSDGRMDRRDWSEEGFPEAVITHEWGHLLGFEHVPDGISTMHPSIHRAAIERQGKPVEGDIREAIKRGYQVRTEPETRQRVSGNHEIVDYYTSEVLGHFKFDVPVSGEPFDGRVLVNGYSTLYHGTGMDKESFFLWASKTKLNKGA